jgi:hypothetical protein
MIDIFLRIFGDDGYMIYDVVDGSLSQTSSDTSPYSTYYETSNCYYYGPYEYYVSTDNGTTQISELYGSYYD